MSDPNQNQPYDWGVPAQPPSGPSQQQGPNQPWQGQPGPQGQGQQPQGNSGSKAKSLRPWLYTIIAVIVIAAVVYAGLWIYQATRGTEKGPLGWDNEQITEHVSGSKLSDCDFGDEFWESVGIKDVEVSGDETTCKGWYETTGGGEVLVTMEIAESKSGVSEPSDSVSLTRDGLRGWSAEEGADDVVRTFVSTEPTEKCTYYSTSGLFLGTLSAPTNCDALKPLASQLTNLDIQDQEASKSRKRTDSKDSGYVDVNPQPVEVTSPLWEKVGKDTAKFGDAQKVEDDDYPGSNITMDNIEVTDSEVCAETTFTRGKPKRMAAHLTDQVPSIKLVLPTGSTLELMVEGSSMPDVKGGETAKLTYCSDPNDWEDLSYRGGKAYLANMDHYGDVIDSTWEFDFGKKA